MVASAVFITDLQGKAIISRNYRGDVPLTKAIEQFAKYLTEVEDEAKKPVFHVDPNGDIAVGDDVGGNGVGGEHFIYVAVSRKHHFSGDIIMFHLTMTTVPHCNSIKMFTSAQSQQRTPM